MYGLLTQAKKDAGERDWLKWLADNREVLGFGERQAQRYLREPDARVSDADRHAEGERKRRAAAKDSKEVTTKQNVEREAEPQACAAKPGKGVAGVEPETDQNTVKAPANEQPTPKKFKLATPKWVQEQVEAISLAASNLRCVYPKLTGRQAVLIGEAQKALAYVVRIGTDFDRVNQAALKLVQVWNQQQGAERVEVDDYLMKDVKEAAACEPDIDRWTRLITRMSEGNSSWFTLENFEGLISTWEGRPDGLEDLEKQEGLPAWDPETSESVEAATKDSGAAR